MAKEAVGRCDRERGVLVCYQKSRWYKARMWPEVVAKQL